MAYSDPEKKREYERLYYQANRERKDAYAKQWALDHPTESQAIKKRWRDNNPDYQAQWYQDNNEKVRENASRWRVENPDKRHASNLRRYARQKGADDHEAVNRLVVAERDGWTCQLCGDPIDPNRTYRDPATGRPDPWYLNVDHIVSLARGGEHSYANCQASHARCNQRKSNKTLTD